MSEILKQESIVTGLAPEPHEEVIRRCGRMLRDLGYVEEGYIEGMIARDRGFSTAIGNLIAIPHGESDYKHHIRETGLVVLTYPEGVAWNGETVKLVIGIAAKGNEHLGILERIVETMETEEDVERLVASSDKAAIHAIFAGGVSA